MIDYRYTRQQDTERKDRMYLNKRIHLLSTSIMRAAFISLIMTAFEGFIRTIVNRTSSYAPDMLDTVLWNIHTVCSVLKIAAIIAVFYFAWKKIARLKKLIADDDRTEMGELQKETFGSELSSLSADAIEQLILIWGVILIGAECVYFITSVIYRKFTTQLMLMAISGARYDLFLPLYNLSHGFKYQEMMTAIVLGVVMTAILLRDRILNITSGVLMLVFLLSFAVFQIGSVSMPGRQISIVWTSVIFHMTETIGLFLLSVYLSRHYRGL